MPDRHLDDMSTDDLLSYVKKRHKKSPDATTKKIVNVVNSQSLEEKFELFHIPVVCPECNSANKVKYAKSHKGAIRYKCKDCGKTFSVTTGTIFEGNSYTWDEMVQIVKDTITFQPIQYTCDNLFGHKVSTGSRTGKGKMSYKNTHMHKIWLLRLKLLYLLSKQPLPKLNGVIQVDEKYFREAQKGSRNLVSFLSKADTRIARRHNHASKAGIFGPEFVCVLSAVDQAKNYWAKCVSLGTCSLNEVKEHLAPDVESVNYICSDAYSIYEEWCDENSYRHYIEPTQCKIERQGFGYIEVSNKHPHLTEEEKRNNRKIAEMMYEERKWYHIRNSGKMNLDTMYLLRKRDNLTINDINSFHSEFEETLVRNVRSVSTKYLPFYVGAFTYLKNWQTKHGYAPTTDKDAQEILVALLLSGSKVDEKDIKSFSAENLPRPTKQQVSVARKKMDEIRQIAVKPKPSISSDKSEYEGDSAFAPFVFDKRKFFSSLGAIRLNDLVKQNGLYFKGQHKEDKVRKLCALPDADKIIAYEIYLHSYATPQEIQAAKTKRPKYLYKKRGRKKKNPDE